MKKKKEVRKRIKKVKCGLCHEEIDLHLVNLVPMHKRCANSLKGEVKRNDKSD